MKYNARDQVVGFSTEALGTVRNVSAGESDPKSVSKLEVEGVDVADISGVKAGNRDMSERSCAEREAVDVVESCSLPPDVAGSDRSGFPLNKLPKPLTITLGCIPRKGVSKPTTPKTRCREGLPCPPLPIEVSNATSAASNPPILCPSSTMSVLLDSCCCNLAVSVAMTVSEPGRGHVPATEIVPSNTDLLPGLESWIDDAVDSVSCRELLT